MNEYKFLEPGTPVRVVGLASECGPAILRSETPSADLYDQLGEVVGYLGWENGDGEACEPTRTGDGWIGDDGVPFLAAPGQVFEWARGCWGVEGERDVPVAPTHLYQVEMEDGQLVSLYDFEITTRVTPYVYRAPLPGEDIPF